MIAESSVAVHAQFYLRRYICCLKLVQTFRIPKAVIRMSSKKDSKNSSDKETKAEQGPMSEDAQMRLKTGATKGGLTKSDGSKPEPSEEDVKSKGGMSKDAQVRIISLVTPVSRFACKDEAATLKDTT